MAFSKNEAPNCNWCPYRKNCFFELLDKQSRGAWKEMRVANRFRAGEVVFYEGDRPRGLFVVCTGKVKVFKSSRTGQQLVTRIESPGDLVGHRSLLAGDSYSGTAETMEESVISLVDEPSFKDFLMKHPKAALALLGALAHDVRRGEDKARDIAFKPARSRLATTLLDVARPGKNRLAVTGIKRKDLAEMSGLTIETTVRLLKDFEKRALLKKESKDLLITDEPNLRSIAERFT
ncbi:MAG: Crp/Fnr family transcriptional regulator [Elusimicrobia bacterium]|nr:Crp/Fnr family transcriptional regulator [Elusimicrobiota bacterium]